MVLTEIKAKYQEFSIFDANCRISFELLQVDINQINFLAKEKCLHLFLFLIMHAI